MMIQMQITIRVMENDDAPPPKRTKRTYVTAASQKKNDIQEPKLSQNDNVVNPLKEQAHLQTQPLQMIFLTAQVKKCIGCNTFFTPAERKEPVDLIFMVFMHRPRSYTDKPWGRAERKSKAYFHIHNMGYFQRFKEVQKLKPDNIYMTNQVYGQLTKEHVSYLEKLHLWDHFQ